MPSPVVIIEDDPDVLHLLREVLESEGIPHHGVDSFNAERIARACPDPAAFLIDLMLPAANGVDLARQLRGAFPEAPMIAMSASRLMLEVATKSGLFQESVAKPFNLSTLLDAIERVAGGFQCKPVAS